MRERRDTVAKTVADWELLRDIAAKIKLHTLSKLADYLEEFEKNILKLKNSVICLTITDDGSGFDANKTRKGIGIKNITSRVNEIQGELIIDSQKDIGTSLSINVPV